MYCSTRTKPPVCSIDSLQSCSMPLPILSIALQCTNEPFRGSQALCIYTWHACQSRTPLILAQIVRSPRSIAKRHVPFACRTCLVRGSRNHRRSCSFHGGPPIVTARLRCRVFWNTRHSLLRTRLCRARGCVRCFNIRWPLKLIPGRFGSMRYSCSPIVTAARLYRHIASSGTGPQRCVCACDTLYRGTRRLCKGRLPVSGRTGA